MQSTIINTYNINIFMSNSFKKLFYKYKKILSYIFFAVITSIVNVSIYILCYHCVISNIIISNIVAYSCSIILSFFLNKNIVFKDNKGKILKQFIAYLALKMFSLFIDSCALILLYDYLHMNNFISKLIANASTTISNYFLNKCYIFKNS